MQFKCGGEPIEIDLSHLVVAGWTGRDADAIQHHIEELAAIGVTPPSRIPLYYRVSAPLLTTAKQIQVVGDASSGEVEPLVLQTGTARYLGLGSDHTDRALEAHSVALSKQACAKPCAPDLWQWDDVASHLEEIQLQSWIFENGDWSAYQNGTVAAIRPLDELMSGARLKALAADGAAAMMCGTFGAKGGVRAASGFRMRMTDPVLGRSIEHEYTAVQLANIA